MAKRKRDRQRITIDHFRGVHQEINPDDYTYSRAVMGLVDEHGGMLARLGGKISAGSNPMSSIWGLHQLRFKDNWGIVVHNGSSRDWYDHNAYKGPEDGIIMTPTADPTVEVIPGDILPGDNWPHEQDPAYCHSDFVTHWGKQIIPITDAVVFYRDRSGGPYSNFDTSCVGVLDETVAAILAGFAAGGAWSNWHACVPGATVSSVSIGGATDIGGGNWWGVGTWVQRQWTIQSPTLANANPGDYSGALSILGTMELNIGNYIGEADWADAPVNSPGTEDCPNREAGMIFTDDTVPASAATEAALAGCAGGPSHDTHEHDFTCGEEDVHFLSNIMGWFEHVESCFEE